VQEVNLILQARCVSLMIAIPIGRFCSNALADSPSPDTSDWKCTQCPFLQGYTGEAEAGVLDAQRRE
jgi:hypothetical protein